MVTNIMKQRTIQKLLLKKLEQNLFAFVSTSQLYRESFVLPIETSRRQLNRQYSQVSKFFVVLFIMHILIDCFLLCCQRFMFFHINTSRQWNSWLSDVANRRSYFRKVLKKLIFYNAWEVHKHCVTTSRKILNCSNCFFSSFIRNYFNVLQMHLPYAQ